MHQCNCIIPPFPWVNSCDVPTFYKTGGCTVFMPDEPRVDEISPASLRTTPGKEGRGGRGDKILLPSAVHLEERLTVS